MGCDLLERQKKREGMAGRKTKARAEQATDAYLELVRQEPLRPIRSAAKLAD